MIWFTSDQHYWHENIIKYCNRPYANAAEMNESLIANYNQLVKPEDTVYHLGDFSMAFRPVETYVHRLNGTKHLIAGNHDFCSYLHKKSRTSDGHVMWTNKYIECGFTSVSTEGLITIAGQEVLMHHMPYNGDHGVNDRYTEHRPKDEGKWLLHGHLHGKYKTKDHMIDVGVDVWDFKPVSIDTIASIILKETRG